jgi:hypothetical protein
MGIQNNMNIDIIFVSVFHYAEMSRMKLLWNGGGGLYYMELTSSS